MMHAMYAMHICLELNGKIFFVPAPKKFNDEYRLGKLSAKRLLALVKK